VLGVVVVAADVRYGTVVVAVGELQAMVEVQQASGSRSLQQHCSSDYSSSSSDSSRE